MSSFREQLSLQLYRSWLDTRPNIKLMALWEDAMRAKREVEQAVLDQVSDLFDFANNR